MRTSVERWRFGLLVGAGLLVLVIAAFLGYARYRIHRAVAALPGRLGATITKEFNGYTYSQSDGKRTIFTIHAAKATQHNDGIYSLHDVNMVLYGHAGDRADRISGDDFEYDTKAEVIRAIGIVHLDLDAPAPENVDARKHLAGAADAPREDASPHNRVIHVKTSGLVYTRKLGVATTDQGIEFAFGGFTGHAVGAEYNSATGHVVLQSAITVSGLDHGRPIALASSHGELDRATSLAVLANARYSSAGQSAQAESVRIHLRPDGSVERIEGERHVQLAGDSQGNVTSDRADIALSAIGKPATAVLTGSVRFIDEAPLRQASGDSNRANLHFDEQGRLDHALLEGGVRTYERLRAAGNVKEPWSERTLTANALDLNLVSEGTDGKPQLNNVKASGSARLTTATASASSTNLGSPKGTTSRLSADILTAHLLPARGNAELSTVHGSGNTRIQQVNPEGLDQTSSGDLLDATFRDTVSDKVAAAAAKHTSELATAVQQGSVSIERRLPAKKGAQAGAPAEVQHATARMASYDAASQRLTLTGDVQMSEPGSVLRAAQVAMQQDTGDVTAEGSVKVTYLQAGSAEPVHVLAARAELDHDADRVTFYGRPLLSVAGSNPPLARMWQAGEAGHGGSQIEAPVLVLEQEAKRLVAHAETPGAHGEVHAALEDRASKNAPVLPPSNLKSGTAQAKLPQGVVRISSTQLVYSDLKRQAEFTGGVRVLDGNGELRAAEATVFLSPASTASKPAPQPAAPTSSLTGLFGGSVERIVATQHIEITQPGRQATGERLVYTASDQMFVLTGTAAVLPKVVDAQQGTTTGAALRFHSGDNSVSISGQDGETAARKVHTETRIKQ